MIKILQEIKNLFFQITFSDIYFKIVKWNFKIYKNFL